MDFDFGHPLSQDWHDTADGLQLRMRTELCEGHQYLSTKQPQVCYDSSPRARSTMVRNTTTEAHEEYGR